MNVKQVIKALKPAEGHRVVLVSNAPPEGYCASQSCVKVKHLPPNQRQRRDQGNVILWNGLTNADGTPAGHTFCASDIKTITTHPSIDITVIYTKNNTIASIIIMEKLNPDADAT